MKQKSLLLLTIFLLFILTILLLFLSLNNIYLIYTFFILILVEIGLFIFLVNKSWTNKFLETVGTGFLAGLLVSLFRDSFLKNINGAEVHYYLILFIFSIALIIIGAFSESQNY